MKNYFLFFIALFSFNLTFYSQKTGLDVRDQNLTEYPLVKGELWARNPNGISIESVLFYENDVPLKVAFQPFTQVNNVPKNKSIVFLVLNTPNKSEMDWYKSVLKEAISKGAIRKGDKIEIITFGCKVNEQLLFPNTFNFTDDADVLFKRIDEISINNRPQACSQRSHIYLSIHEALDLYSKKHVDMPAGIFVLADDRALQPIFEVEQPGQRSRRLNIPVYAISYFKENTFFDIEGLCNQTYGQYYRDRKNDVKESSDMLLKFMNDFNQRYAGVTYPFSYTSTFEKDGKTHSVKIDSKEGQSGFALMVPNKNLLEWIETNLMLSVVLFVLFIGIVIILIIQYRNYKKKQIEEEQKRKAQLAEMEKNQQEAEMKLSSQEAELKKLQEEENRKRENDLRLLNEQNQKAEDAIQLRKMLERGNLPWFEYRFESETGQCQIESPRYTVGRDPSNNWTINHPTVSRNHFTLTFKDYVYTIMDLGSSNGVFVNGHKTNETQLKHGDHIQVGDISLTFHI